MKQEAAAGTQPPDPAPSEIPEWRTATDPNVPGSSLGRNLSPAQRDVERKVIGVLRTIYDPEIPVNIYELGLVYGVEVKEDLSVHVRMTLTAPACPVAGSLPGQVEAQIENIDEVKSATVELVWDPPWDRGMMSEAAQLQLGLL